MSDMKEQDSFLKLYSLGIVVENKEKGSNTIKVTPIEKIRLSKGKLADQKYEYNETMPDSRGVSKTKSVTGSDMIEAKWLPFGDPNRMNAPDVYKNETVAIWRFADTDEYHWTTIFQEPEIRRLETVCIGASNMKDGLKSYNKESSYWFELSTDEQQVVIQTSKSNGESFEYTFKIDTSESTVEIKDDIGNSIKLDSKNNSISINTLEKVEITTKTVNVSCDDYTINCRNYDVNASDNSTTSSSGSMTMKATGGITLDAPTVTNTGDEVTNGSSTANPHYNCVV